MGWYPGKNINLAAFEDWITGTTGNTTIFDQLITNYQNQNDPTVEASQTLDDLAQSTLDQYGDMDFFTMQQDALAAARAEVGSSGQTAGYWTEQAGAIDYGQSFEDWAAENGYELNDTSAERGGMQDLIDQLENPDTEEGFSHSARMLGFASDEEAQEAIETFRLAMEGGSGAQQGMSPEDMALRQRMNQTNMREMEARSKRLVQNSFANSGSTVQMLAAADEASRGLSLAQFQQDEALAREQVERQVTQWNEQSSMYARMVESRQMSYSQFMGMKTASLSAAMEGYSSKINAMLSENAQYLQQHQGDMAILEANANRMFAMADMQLGLTERTYTLANQIYDSQVQPIRDALNALIISGELSPEMFTQVTSYLLQIGSIVAGVV